MLKKKKKRNGSHGPTGVPNSGLIPTVKSKEIFERYFVIQCFNISLQDHISGLFD